MSDKIMIDNGPMSAKNQIILADLAHHLMDEQKANEIPAEEFVKYFFIFFGIATIDIANPDKELFKVMCDFIFSYKKSQS